MSKPYSQVLLELARADERIFGVSCDTWWFVSDLAREFPERAIEVGIAEQNLIGVSAGLAVRGKIPFAHGMAPFVTMRCFEQIRTDLGYGARNVKVIAAYSGGMSMAGWGPTHHAIEDTALMRLIPGMTVIMPVDAVETEAATRAAAAHDGPVYLCLAGGELPLLPDPRPFRIGKAVVLRDGEDVTIIGTGPTVRDVIKAGDILAARGISAHLINLHTVKPIDKEAILSAAARTKAVITVEEHTVIAGLGGAVAEVMAESPSVPLRRLGLQDTFCRTTGPYEELKDRYGLSVTAIVRAAEEEIR